MADELLRLQSQVTALSTAWLYLAASVELHGGLDPEGFERALLAARIPCSSDHEAIVLPCAFRPCFTWSGVSTCWVAIGLAPYG